MIHVHVAIIIFKVYSFYRTVCMAGIAGNFKGLILREGEVIGYIG